jgi:putative hydrolase of the HAD superfamily
MKAVLFDLGHTLIDYYCDWKGPEARAVARVQDLLAKNSPAEIDSVEFTSYLSTLLVATRERKAREMVEVPLVDLMGQCLDRYGCLEEDLLLDTLEIFYGVLQEERKPVPGAKELLERLREQGLSIGLVSDVAWGLPSEFPLRDMKLLGLEEFFDDMVFSTDVGLRKPHPKVFKIALSNLQVAPEEAVFIGNSLRADIKGALGVGMRTVWKESCYPEMDQTVTPDHTIRSLDEVDALLD